MIFWRKKKAETRSVICLSQKSLSAVLKKLQDSLSQDEYKVVFDVEAWMSGGKVVGFFVKVPESQSLYLQTVSIETDGVRLVR